MIIASGLFMDLSRIAVVLVMRYFASLQSLALKLKRVSRSFNHSSLGHKFLFFAAIRVEMCIIWARPSVDARIKCPVSSGDVRWRYLCNPEINHKIYAINYPPDQKKKEIKALPASLSSA
jgi:hypothetical protein